MDLESRHLPYEQTQVNVQLMVVNTQAFVLNISPGIYDAEVTNIREYTLKLNPPILRDDKIRFCRRRIQIFTFLR